MKITRDIVTDLWPLVHSGEASADTRRLVEEFLREDPEFARLLKTDASARLLGPVPVPLTPDHELAALTRTRRALALKEWPIFFAMLFSCLTFGRLVADTSWDVSPRACIATASIAAAFWIWFLVRLVKRLTR